MILTISGDRFVALSATPEDEKLLRDAGFRWDDLPENRHWYTTSATVAAAFYQYSNVAAKTRIETVRRSVKSSHSEETTFDFPCPYGMNYRQYQKAGIAYAYSRWGTLFGDEMGLGKTIQAIGLMNAVGDDAFPAIIVCPAHLRQNWYREISEWLVQRHRTVYVSWDGSFPFDYYGHICVPDVLICNYERLRGDWLNYATSVNWGTSVVDEVHYIKNASSQRARAIFGHRQNLGVWNVSKRKLALSGTAIENRTSDIWPLANALAPEEFPSKAEFVNLYCGGRLDGAGSARAAELQEKLRSSFMIRRLKKDVLKELPPKQRQLVCVRPDDDDTKEILAQQNRELKILGIDMALDSDIEKLVDSMESGDPIAFSRVSRFRAILGERKAPYVAQHVGNILSNRPDHQTIVFAHHKRVCEYLAGAFAPFGVAVINGDTPQRMRQDIADAFCAGRYRVIVCSLEAAATGFNLQAAWHVVFAEIAWKPSTNQQAEARVDRYGQQNPMLMQYFAFDNSLDARIMDLNLRKQKTADAVLDKNKETV